MMAAEEGDVAVVAMLLEHNACVEIQNQVNFLQLNQCSALGFVR